MFITFSCLFTLILKTQAVFNAGPNQDVCVVVGGAVGRGGAGLGSVDSQRKIVYVQITLHGLLY